MKRKHENSAAEDNGLDQQLRTAARRNNARLIGLLLNEGADVNAVALDGQSALMIAALNGHAEVVTTLLADQRTNVNAVDPNGQSALMAAADGNHDNAEIVTALLGRGANIGSVGRDGWNALMIAANNNHAEITTTLINRGADVNATGHNGLNALIIAANSDNTEVINAIITNTSLLQRNNGTDWQYMVFGNLGNPAIQNHLTQETVTLLEGRLPAGNLLNSIIQNFNQRNQGGVPNPTVQNPTGQAAEEQYPASHSL